MEIAMKRLVVPVLAALLAVAIGTTATHGQTAPAPAVDPIGTFEFTTAVQGQTVTGTITIAKTDNVLGGKILTDAMPEIPIKSVQVEGKKMTIYAEIPDGALTITLEFEDANKFAGNWTLGGDGGAISGKRKTAF
jgi:hypothetical protein